MGSLFYIYPKIAVCALRCCYLFVAKWQTVRSCRGPIYRARVYECTHEIGNGNAYLIM